MKLILFDADGTLVKRDTGEMLPGVRRWFDRNRGRRFQGHHVAVAIVTNQGGPACHDAGWPHSDHFPSLGQVEARYGGLAHSLTQTAQTATVSAPAVAPVTAQPAPSAPLPPLEVAPVPLACDDCGRTFGTPNALRAHKRFCVPAPVITTNGNGAH